MPSRKVLRPLLLLSLLSSMTFSVMSLHAPEQQSDALPRYLVEPNAAPSVQTFTAGSNYDLEVVVPDTYRQHVPDYNELRNKAMAYAQAKVQASYAQADTTWQQAQTTAKSIKKTSKTKTSTTKPGEKPSVQQWTCLNNLWTGESGWQVYAVNKQSGAYGIAQALPATKMAAQGKDWRDNYKTQIDWGFNYISSRYGTPCKAWDTWQSRSPHWY